MNARALGAWTVAAIAVVVATNNPWIRAFALLAAVNFAVSRHDLRRALPVLARTSAIAAGLSLLLNILLSHSGSHPVATLPLPLVGGPVTLESLSFGVTTGLALAAAILISAPISTCIEPADLAEAIPTPLHRTGATVAAALNLVPELARSHRAIREAQMFRRRGGFEFGAVLVPATLTALENSIQVAEAMEARAWASGPRTRYSQSSWSRADVIVVAASAAALLLLALARVSGQLGDWYPFPTFTVPLVPALGAASTILLLTPSLAWRSPISAA